MYMKGNFRYFDGNLLHHHHHHFISGNTAHKTRKAMT